MDDLEKEEEEEELLNLSLSLVSHSEGDRNTRRKKNSNRESSTSRGSSDGGDHCDHHHHHHHQVEILGLLQQREQMLRRVNHTEEDRRNKDPHIIHLLLRITTSIDEYNFSSAVADLTKMYQNASLTGDSVQRAAAYFADGLTAKLLKEKPSLYDMIMKEPTSGEEFLAFTHLYKASPCYQFSHFTANQAILEAFEREQGRNNSGLQVLDFDLAYGFQWPSLIQSLSEKANTTNTVISLRIAGFARSLEELVETEARLVSFSKGFANVAFEFQGLLRGSNQIHDTVKRRENETLAVNLVSCLHSSRNNTFFNTLDSIRCLHPSIVVLVQQAGGPGPANLMDSLHYYTAMFDSLDDCLPRDNLERLSIERNHLGKEVKNAVVNCFISAKYERLMEDYGFCGIKLSSRTVMQAKLLLRMRNPNNPGFVQPDFNAGFRVSETEDGKAISLVWQHREFITASAWQSV